MRVHDKKASTFPLTYDDYALLPQDRNRYEILEGELYMTPSPLLIHQVVLIRLEAAELGMTFDEAVQRARGGRSPTISSAPISACF